MTLLQLIIQNLYRWRIEIIYQKKVMYIDKLTPLDLLFPQPRQLREDYDGSLL